MRTTSTKCELVGTDAGSPADRNPALVYLARLAVGSKPAMAGALDTAARILSSGAVSGVDFPWHQLRYQHTAALRAALLNKDAAPATVNKTLCAVRGVMKEAWRLGLMNAEAYARAADVKTVKQDRLPAGRALNPRKLAALFQECAKDPLPTGRRDAALLAVLYGAGLRRAEAEALNLADFDTETGALTVHGGKGNKDRIAYSSNGSKDALADWLEARGYEPGPLFVAGTPRGGHLKAKRLTSHGMAAALTRRAKAAGVAAFSPHDLRRTMITNLLDAGADITTVANLAGHASVTTTAKYDRRGEETKRHAAAMLAVPYTRIRARAE